MAKRKKKRVQKRRVKKSLLPNQNKNVKSQKRKKSLGKATAKRTKSKANTRGKSTKRKPRNKTAVKRQVNTPVKKNKKLSVSSSKQKRTSKSVRLSKRKTGKPQPSLSVEPQQRGSKKLEYSFKNVRSVGKKISLFKEKAKDSLKKQLKKRGGKPPRGIIVTVTDKKGREKTEVSSLDFVVNTETTQQFVSRMMERMKDDFLEWKDMHGDDGDEDGDSDAGYGDYNPDSISSITIRFIYMN